MDAATDQWLILVYRIPSTPTTLRSAVWRRLKAAGAVYLVPSVVAFPKSPSGQRVAFSLRSSIRGMGGSAYVLQANALAGGAEILATFNAARDGEYTKIVTECGEFQRWLEDMMTAAPPGHRELAEAEDRVSKLARRYEQICARDAFGAPLSAPAAAELSHCRRAVDRFADEVFRSDEPERDRPQQGQD